MSTARTLDDWGKRVAFGTKPVRIDHASEEDEYGEHYPALIGNLPPMVDTARPDHTIPGMISIRCPDYYPGIGELVSKDDAVKRFIALTLTSAMHEIAELLHIDGERVFNPHPDQENDMWDFLIKVADGAASRIMWSHPR